MAIQTRWCLRISSAFQYQRPTWIAPGPIIASNSLLTDPIGLRKVSLLPNHGVVAQLVRASACHAEGRGFESRPSRHFDSGPFRSETGLFHYGSVS